MYKVALIQAATASLTLMAAAAQAAAPQMLKYSASVATTGLAALATTNGTFNHPRSAYVVAATTDPKGKLVVTAWQDTTKTLQQVGQSDLGGNKVEALAAAGLDASHIVTADIDDEGTLYIKTWTIGGSAGVALLNNESVLSAGAPLYVEPPDLVVSATSPTQVVTALQDANGKLSVQAWSVSDTSTAPMPMGSAWNGGAANQVSMAVIDSATVITATTIPFTHTLVVSTLGVDSSGVHLQDQKTLAGVVGGGLYPSVSIGAGSELVGGLIGDGLPGLREIRSAFTPIVTSSENIEVIYWNISSTGKISEVAHPPSNPDIYIQATAACMLPANVPISVYFDQSPAPDSAYDVYVGWYGQSGKESEYSALPATLDNGISSLLAVTAGTNYSALNPYSDYDAYFITGAVTYTGTDGTETDATLQIRVWSDQVPPSLL
jgi:hypothetical protein